MSSRVDRTKGKITLSMRDLSLAFIGVTVLLDGSLYIFKRGTVDPNLSQRC
jgi:hypothetical protein